MHEFLNHGWRSGPLPIAHRGDSARHPENTMEAFEAAYALGYRYLETDVHATRDGKLVVFHDETLDRMTDGSGPIAGQTWDTLCRLRIAGTARIPLLADLLDRWSDTRFIIDPKADGAVEPLYRTLADRNAWDRVCVGSFSGQRIQWLRQQAGPQLCTSTTPMETLRLRLGSMGLPSGRFRARCIQAPLRHRGFRVMTPRFLAAARRHGLPVQAWTINDRQTMERLIEIGVDAIMTDEAERLKSLLQDHGTWQDP